MEHHVEDMEHVEERSVGGLMKLYKLQEVCRAPPSPPPRTPPHTHTQNLHMHVHTSTTTYVVRNFGRVT